MKKETLYLSGPMRNYPNHNFPAFDAAAEHLRTAGFEIVSPADLDRGLGFEGDDDVTDDQIGTMLRADIDTIVHRCSGIALLDNWLASEGARMELAVAASLNLDIYRYDQYSRSLTPYTKTEVYDLMFGKITKEAVAFA